MLAGCAVYKEAESASIIKVPFRHIPGCSSGPGRDYLAHQPHWHGIGSRDHGGSIMARQDGSRMVEVAEVWFCQLSVFLQSLLSLGVLRCCYRKNSNRRKMC